jgi:hypothetical protein
VGGLECHRADLPFLQAAEEAAIQTIVVEPWVVVVVEFVAVVVLWIAYEGEGRAFVIVEAACAG